MRPHLGCELGFVIGGALNAPDCIVDAPDATDYLMPATLEPGLCVLNGSITGVVGAYVGEQIHIDYGRLGSISCPLAEA
jgi:2-keto-4-pentenoate hydratase